MNEMSLLPPQPTDHLEVDEGLAQLGFDSFRPGQREAVETLLSSGRLLLVAPTGGGKSLVYQLPAAILPGTTIVVSPLIALMHDQVLALEDRGVASTYLAGTLDPDEMRRRMSEASLGAYKLIYVAPERLMFDGFRGMVSRLDCPLVAIDEAHCISEWGHDFRPDYMRIGELIRDLPNARVLACTATATPIVRDEIIARLGLPVDTPQLVKGFARPNLALRVREILSRAEGNTHVDLLLRECLQGPGERQGTAIVYSPTRKRTDAEAQRLAQAGWQAEAYHAGMEGDERSRVQTAFANGKVEVVVATNAFGMGIDRHDVRCIAHLAPPSSVEAYYQEAGRAGRDGEDAACLLLVSPGDMALRRFLIESDSNGKRPDEDTVRHKWGMFLELMRWAEGGSCRHDAILRYFGDEEETLSGCGRCDVCLTMGDGDAADEEEATTIVRKALCGVARVHGRFGIQVAAKLLKGVGDDRLNWSGLAKTTTYGTLESYSEDWILTLLRRCVTAGWVDFHGGQRPVVVVTEEGQDVIHERRPARLLLPTVTTARVKAPASRRGGKKIAADGIELDNEGRDLFEALRSWRVETARKEKVPPYVIGSDRTLREIAMMRPTNEGDLALAHGIGPAKVAKYGEAILDVLRSAR
jgi:ATP-dependent DNA helicase RecQ